LPQVLSDCEYGDHDYDRVHGDLMQNVRSQNTPR
jgi:hypothetical protein